MTDAEMVAGLRERSHEALAELIQRYGDRLARSAYLLCGSETEAQDFVQETLVQAMRSAHRFAGQSALYTWLHGILLNLTRHYHRKQRRVIYTDTLPEASALVHEAGRQMDLDAATHALMDALPRLSPPHHEVVVLRYYEGMRLEEIARQLGVSKGTVKSRLHYATEALRGLLPREMNLFESTGTY